MGLIANVQPDKLNMIQNGVSASADVGNVLPVYVRGAYLVMVGLGSFFIIFWIVCHYLFQSCLYIANIKTHHVCINPGTLYCDYCWMDGC